MRWKYRSKLSLRAIESDLFRTRIFSVIFQCLTRNKIENKLNSENKYLISHILHN